MKKIIIQYLYILVITVTILFLFTWANACEEEKILDETPPICENEQVSTKENPCKEYQPNINELTDAIKKLGESGTLPK